MTAPRTRSPLRARTRAIRRRRSCWCAAWCANPAEDRKSTRLNSSHLVISYAVFCLKKKVRREMLEAIVRTVADEGRTVFFSSHLLDEIERVSDRVAMMACGRVVLQGRLDEILESHFRLTLRFPTPAPTPPKLAGALLVTGSGLEWTVLCNGARGELEAAVVKLGARIVDETAASLDEIFLARVGRERSTGETLQLPARSVTSNKPDASG